MMMVMMTTMKGWILLISSCSVRSVGIPFLLFRERHAQLSSNLLASRPVVISMRRTHANAGTLSPTSLIRVQTAKRTKAVLVCRGRGESPGPRSWGIVYLEYLCANRQKLWVSGGLALAGHDGQRRRTESLSPTVGSAMKGERRSPRWVGPNRWFLRRYCMFYPRMKYVCTSIDCASSGGRAGMGMEASMNDCDV